MAADNFLGLTNRVLKPINEVPLTSSDFAAAIGIHADAQDAVNQGILDVYTYKSVLWPFLFSELTFNTSRGIIEYVKPATVTKVDWSSFTIQRGTGSISSLTRSGTTATAVTPSAHNLETGDYIEILGATPDGYNLPGASVIVVSPTSFTFEVADGLTTPATGTITFKSNTVHKAALAYVDKDEYIKSYAAQVENATSSSYKKPEFISRKPDNSFIVFDAPDRVYTCKYSAYSIPERLSLWSDTHSIPEAYEQAIVDNALHYIYMFRDNIEQASLAKQRADQRLAAMVRVLSPFANNFNTP